MRTLEVFTLSYLLNSLWQVPLVFAAAWIAARAVRRIGPAAEHRVWVAAIALEALLPACAIPQTQIFSALMRLIPWFSASSAAHADSQITIVSGAASVHGALHLPPHLLAAIALAYACSVTYFALRLVLRLYKTHTMRREAQRIVLTGAAAATWNHCCGIFAVHDTEVAISNAIICPATVGIRRRILLLTAHLLQTLHAEDLDAAIAHEFAHMHRRDFAKNLLYIALALPIAWHPALWLTRIRMEESREMVCDAMAADALAGSQQYARSLLRLASLFVQAKPDKTLHAIGIFDANIFERRIMNLTQTHIELRGARRLATAAACMLISLGTCASAMALRMNVAAPSLQSDSQQATQAGAVPHVSARVMAGNRLNFVAPIYPPEAKAAGVEGKVVLSARIGKDGTLEALKLVSGPAELSRSAWAAVRDWTYRPYLLNGKPTAVDTTITVTYSLQH